MAKISARCTLQLQRTSKLDHVSQDSLSLTHKHTWQGRWTWRVPPTFDFFFFFALLIWTWAKWGPNCFSLCYECLFLLSLYSLSHFAFFVSRRHLLPLLLADPWFRSTRFVGWCDRVDWITGTQRGMRGVLHANAEWCNMWGRTHVIQYIHVGWQACFLFRHGHSWTFLQHFDRTIRRMTLRKTNSFINRDFLGRCRSTYGKANQNK